MPRCFRNCCWLAHTRRCWPVGGLPVSTICGHSAPRRSSALRQKVRVPLSSNGAADLEVDQFVVGLAKGTQDLVGVLGESRGPGNLCRLLVELDRVGDQFPGSALSVE